MARARRKLRVVGVDENGLGPRLGPLLATAVSLDLTSYGPRKVASLAALGRELGVDDSKATSGFGKMREAESFALAVARAENEGEEVRDVDALLRVLTLEGPLGLRAPCPKRSAPQCFSVPLPLPLFGGRVEDGEAMLEGLREAGVRLRRARSSVVCARVLNAELPTLGSKLAIDLERFERLLLDARAASPAPLIAICGMVGGLRMYQDRFHRFPASAVEILEEKKGVSRYRLADLGEVAFEVSSDKNHLPVAMASMVGKYLRELWMERQNRFYRGHDPSLPEASGYHDRFTKAQIRGTEALRARLGIEDACYLRGR